MWSLFRSGKPSVTAHSGEISPPPDHIAPQSLQSAAGTTDAEKNPSSSLLITPSSRNKERWFCLGLHIILVFFYTACLVVGWYRDWHIGNTIVQYDLADKGRKYEFVSFGISAVPQVCGTLYTAALVAVTQKLSLRRSLLKTQSLTVTHDTVHAWLGLGAAFVALRRQFALSTSASEIILVACYLGCMTAIHVVTGSLFGLDYWSEQGDSTYQVWLYINLTSSCVSLAASVFATIFAGRLVGRRWQYEAPIAKDEEDIGTAGVLQVIRLVQDKPNVLRRIKEADDSSGVSFYP